MFAAKQRLFLPFFIVSSLTMSSIANKGNHERLPYRLRHMPSYLKNWRSVTNIYNLSQLFRHTTATIPSFRMNLAVFNIEPAVPHDKKPYELKPFLLSTRINFICSFHEARTWQKDEERVTTAANLFMKTVRPRRGQVRVTRNSEMHQTRAVNERQRMDSVFGYRGPE